MTFLETQRLILRQVRPEDADVMFDYRSNEICARYQRDQVKDLEGIRALVEKRREDMLTTQANALIAVALKGSGEMVGEIVVMPNEGCISLGYTFSYRHHRKGYAYEALSALTDLLHEQTPDWEFISFVEPENVASIGLLKKLGYEDLGYIEKLESLAFGKWLGEDPLR